MDLQRVLRGMILTDKPVVVIVEDDPNVASFIEATLSTKCDTMVASDGKRALEMLNKVDPDLVVLDVRLPVVSGLEVCRKIRGDERFNKAKLLVVTGFPNSLEMSQINDIGVDALLEKPVTPYLLRKTVVSLLGRGNGRNSQIRTK